VLVRRRTTLQLLIVRRRIGRTANWQDALHSCCLDWGLLGDASWHSLACCLGCIGLVERTPVILLPRSASDGSLVVCSSRRCSSMLSVADGTVGLRLVSLRLQHLLPTLRSGFVVWLRRCVSSLVFGVTTMLLLVSSAQLAAVLRCLPTLRSARCSLHFSC